MKKADNVLNDRRKFVKRVVNSSKDTSKAVKRLSKRLFLSEQTIYNDLKY